MTADLDAVYMARALQLAGQGLYTTDPNPYVGCVLVRDGRIIGEGWTQPAGYAHAEIVALSGCPDSHGATAYVTLEPCSHHGRTGPCCDALIAAGIVRVVAAMQDPNPQVSGRGLQKLQAAGVVVQLGLLAEQAAELNKGFFKRMNRGLPWIRSKLAMSLDGRTALASGESKWITSEQARNDVHRGRAESSAILTGVGTVLADDPRLDARVDWPVKQPVKVVLDSSLQTPPTASLLQTGTETWIVTCHDDPDKTRRLTAAGAKIWRLPAHDGRPDLLEVFELLGAQQINSVWIEAGATLNGALLDSGLVDEWLIYLAPCLLGDEGRGLFHLPGLERMQDSRRLKLRDSRQIGPDLKLTLTSVTTG